MSARCSYELEIGYHDGGYQVLHLSEGLPDALASLCRRSIASWELSAYRRCYLASWV
mgnify:FL=1